MLQNKVVNRKKLLEKIQEGNSDGNIPYDSACMLLERMGFSSRQMGTSHRVFSYPGIPEIINLQPVQGRVKRYQVKQIREILQKHRITL